MLRNWTYLFCCFTLLLVSNSLIAQDNSSCLSFQLEDVRANPNSEFCINLKTQGFENVLGLQGSILYDPSVLQFTQTKNFGLPGLSTASFGTPSVGPEKTVTYSWASPTAMGVDLADGQTMAQLCFQPLVESGKTIVEFSKQPTPIELIDGNLRLLSATFLAAEVQIGEGEASDLEIDELCILPSICGEIGQGFVEVVASTNTAPLTYSWMGPNGFASELTNFEAPTGGYYQLEVVNAEGEIARAGVQIGSEGVEQGVSADITNVNCTQDSSGAIELSYLNPDNSYTFQWSTGETTQSIYDLVPGTYTVTITETTSGCSIERIFNLVEEGLRGGLFTKCLGDNQVELWALIFESTGNPVTFAWSTGETSSEPNEHRIIVPADPQAEYSVTVTDLFGCSIHLSTQLPDCESTPTDGSSFDGCLNFEVEKVVANAGEIACVDVTVQDFQKLVGLQYSINWKPDELAFIEVKDFVLGNAATSFGVTTELLENGRLTFAWTDPSTLSRSLADSETLFTLCFEVLLEEGQASISITGDPTPMEALWYNENTLVLQTISLGAIDGGIYVGEEIPAGPLLEEICTEVSGCGSSSNITLSALVSGGIEPFTYDWTGPSGTLESGQQVVVSEAGHYDLVIRDQLGRQVHGGVTVVSPSLEVNFSGQVTSASCTGEAIGSIFLIGVNTEGEYQFQWSNGATTKDIYDLPAGEYTVTVTEDNSGCEAIKSFQVENAELFASLYYNCIDSFSIEVTATVSQAPTISTTFTWSNGVVETDVRQSTVVIAPGDSIAVSVHDDLGCSYSSPVIRPFCATPPSDSFISATYSYTCAVDNESATITAYVLDEGLGPYTFSWSGGPIESDVLQSSYTVPIGGTYQVIISDAFGNSRRLSGIKPNCGDGNGLPLELSIGEANANTGESVCLAVRAKNFINILGLQYAVAWDPDQLELNSIQNFGLPHLSDLDFNLRSPNYENGLLRLAWIDLQGLGVSMPDDAILYEMCFTVTGSGGEVPIFFDVASMQMEFVNDDLQSGIPILDDGLVIINGEERMWPGDTDHNEVANHFDLLNVGLAYGATGPIRENANLIWQGQWATDWGQVTPSTGVDYKHIDTNGDGVINTADTTAISLNWGRAVNLSPNPMAEYRSSLDDIDMQGTPIYVEAYPVRPGETISFDINLGDNENPVEGAYGLAFSIVYDPLAVVYGSAKATFQDSWLGNLGQDMIALVRDDPNNHRLHIGITRIDQSEVNGSGAIGQISMTIEDVIFRDGEYEMPFRVENIRLIRATEAEIEVQQKQTIGTVTDTPLSVGEEPRHERVKIFPNPTADLINIQYRSTNIERIQLLNLGGQLLREYKAMDQISLQGFAPSTYILRFIGVDGAFLKKVIKQ